MQKLQSLKPTRKKRGQHLLIIGQEVYNFNTNEHWTCSYIKLVSLWVSARFVVSWYSANRSLEKPARSHKLTFYDSFLHSLYNLQILFSSPTGVNHQVCSKDPDTRRTWKIKNLCPKGMVQNYQSAKLVLALTFIFYHCNIFVTSLVPINWEWGLYWKISNQDLHWSIQQGWGLRFFNNDWTSEANKLLIMQHFALPLKAYHLPVGIMEE